MALDISSDKDSESVRAEVEKAVRGALGDRIQNGNWVATVRRLGQARAYILDVSNLDGFMRQWVFAPGDLEDVIRQDLQKPQP